MITIRWKNLEDTKRFSSLIANCVFEGFLILASGDLGAGKTRFAKELAINLGVRDNVTSPTFNILKTYTGDKCDFYHIDAYRLEGTKQDLGLEEFIEGDGVCLVEWSEYLEYLLPQDYLKLDITIIDNEERLVKVSGVGSKYEFIEKEIERLW